MIMAGKHSVNRVWRSGMDRIHRWGRKYMCHSILFLYFSWGLLWRWQGV